MSPQGDEEYEREIETVRQGLQGEFWAWIKARANESMATDMVKLLDKRTSHDDAQYLRGYLQAMHDFTTGPEFYVKSADGGIPDDAVEDGADIPLGRRPSPVPDSEP